MKKIYAIYFLCLFGLIISCKKKTTDDSQPPIVNHFKNFTYLGQSTAKYDTTINSITTTWDTTYVDSIKLQVDTANDKIIFTANENNPLGIYPQTTYEFTISSNYFRKNFYQNYYQSFYFEQDSLKSYFYHLMQGSGASYQKEIKFTGYRLP